MRFKYLFKGEKLNILACVKGSDENLKCEVEDFFRTHLPVDPSKPKKKQFGNNAINLLALLEQAADFGVEKFTSKQFGKAGDGAYRFREGRLRIYCVKVDDDLIICSHGTIKKVEGTHKLDLKQPKKILKEVEGCSVKDLDILED